METTGTTTAVKLQGKGRPKKEEGTNDSVIKDPLLGKYHIRLFEDSFILVQTSSVAKERDMGYFTSLGTVLQRVAKLQAGGPNKIQTLREYINEYKELINKLNNQFL